MEIRCPQCGYDGYFKNAKVPFFTFSLLDSHISSHRVKKTFACPKCGCEVMRTDVKIEEPLSRVVLYIGVGLLILATIIILSKLNHG